MSDNVEGHESKPEGEQGQQIDVDSVTKRLEQLESSNKRLLDESKHWKSKYQSEREEKEEREKHQLEQTNDFKGLYEKTLSQMDELKGELTNTKRDSLETALKYEVAKYGKDADDMDILLAAVKTKKRDVVGYDKDVKSWRGVDLAVDELRKSNPGLFKSSIPGMENGRPGSAAPKEKTQDELIQEDPMGVLGDALKDLL